MQCLLFYLDWKAAGKSFVQNFAELVHLVVGPSGTRRRSYLPRSLKYKRSQIWTNWSAHRRLAETMKMDGQTDSLLYFVSIAKVEEIYYTSDRM